LAELRGNTVGLGAAESFQLLRSTVISED